MSTTSSPTAEPAALQRRRQQMAAEQGIAHAEQFPVVALPRNTRPLGPLPESRKAALRAHVAALYRLVYAEPDGVRHWRSPPRLPLAGRACQVCGGACCNEGREEAFLAREAIREFLRRHPEAKMKDVVAAYAACLPEESYVNSCVYHTAAGCALPREMRSDICNRHLCPSLQSAEGLRRAYVVAVDGDGRVQGEQWIEAGAAGNHPGV